MDSFNLSGHDITVTCFYIARQPPPHHSVFITVMFTVNVARLARSSSIISSRSRSLHVTRLCLAGSTTTGQAPASSRQPVERTNSEQNPHLKHSSSSKNDNTGKGKTPPGNAAVNPQLPSKKRTENAAGGKGYSKPVDGRRAYHASSRVSYAESEGDGKHSAESYFKDVDTSPPASTKTHTVSGGDAVNAHRPHEQFADPNKQYATVSKDEPYQPSTAEAENSSGEKKENVKQSNLRYGGKGKESEKGTSGSHEGPAGSNADGRKPEGS